MPDATEIEELGELFSRVGRQHRRATLTALEPCGISPHQARALRMVLRYGPLRPSQLAEHLSIALRSTTQVVDDLVVAGLLDRSPDPVDRRAVQLRVTPAGLKLAARIAAIRAEESRRFLGQLDEADRTELRRILDLLDASSAQP